MSTIIGTETTAKVYTRPREKLIAYWTVTLLLAAAVMLSGIGQLMQYGGNAELVKNLVYPLYILTILGIWKVLGVITLVVPGFPRIKEWVHAGIFFLMTGAALSHTFAKDYGDYGFILSFRFHMLHSISPRGRCVRRAANFKEVVKTKADPSYHQ